MKIKISQTDSTSIAEIISEDIIIKEVQDALDLMANCSYQGSSNIIIHEKNIISDFFDLKTNIAGDILQKFSNYDVRLAIIGNFSNLSSKSLKDFIYESNRVGRINFVSTLNEAKAKLAIN